MMKIPLRRVGVHGSSLRSVLLFALCSLAASDFSAPNSASAWSEFGLEEKKLDDSLSGREVNEPFFEFILSMAKADSMGQWTGADLLAHAENLGTRSRFPLAEFVTLRRSAPPVQNYQGAVVAARWQIRLVSPQDRPMPYSILGYHPGSLQFSQDLALSELAPMDLAVEFLDEGNFRRQEVLDVRIFALEKGQVVLDADGLLDALLGSALDDSWTLGFVVGREEGRLIALGVSLGRKGQRIYGEFDLTADKVLAHGRPLVSALSLATRRWLNVNDGNLPPAWQDDQNDGQ